MKGFIFPGALGVLLWMGACSGGGSGGTATVGQSAHDYLSQAKYTSLVVEIQAVSGSAPDAQTQANLLAFLQSRLNKPAGITFQVDAPLASPGKSTFALSDVQAIETANRKLSNAGTQQAAYFLFLDGDYAGNQGNSQVLGEAYGFSSVVIYEKTVQSLSGGIGQPSRVVMESTVMEHEFGHLLGLVNNGTAMVAPHQDTAHGAHCNVTTCLMFWQVDSSDFIANLLGGNIPSLDADCIQDLQANGGK